MLGAVEEDGRDLDRLVELLGVLGIELGVWLGNARVDRNVRVEDVELEIDAAALREHEPIRLSGKSWGRGHDTVALVHRDGRRGALDFARLALAMVPRLRQHASRRNDRKNQDGSSCNQSCHDLLIAGTLPRAKTFDPLKNVADIKTFRSRAAARPPRPTRCGVA